MKTLIFAFICMTFIGSMAHASNYNVPAGASIQAAINGATNGDTITLTSSATYVENLRIDKGIKLVAAPNQNPKLQNADQSTTSQLIFRPGSSGAQLGSLTGGRITVQYLKWGVATGATLPTGMIRMDQSTGSLVTVENCDIISTGPTTYGMCSGITNGPCPVTVNVRYCNINLNRTADYNAGGVSTSRAYAYGIEIGDTHAANYQTARIPGPTYNIDHVRIKGYVRAGIWMQYTSSTLNVSYTDIGTLGEYGSAGSPNFPWGPFVAYYNPCTYVGHFDHSCFQGPGVYHAFGSIGPNGTSVTLSRCVMVNKMADGQGAYGALFVTNASNTGPKLSSKCRILVDHCDIVDISPTVATGAVGSALLKNGSTTVDQLDLKIRNSNIYSLNNKAINVALVGADAFSSDYNSVLGAGANTGYTIGVHDKLMDPQYVDVAALDMRYNNNILKVSDSLGGPIGVNAGYGDVVSGIVPGWGVVNRAHGWTSLK